jgi:hypothetical protein
MSSFRALVLDQADDRQTVSLQDLDDEILNGQVRGPVLVDVNT